MEIEMRAHRFPTVLLKFGISIVKSWILNKILTIRLLFSFWVLSECRRAYNLVVVEILISNIF